MDATPPSLKPWGLQAGILYGPVRTRRLGLSLGVNLLPSDAKVCSFDCLYCQCGWTVEKDPRAWRRLRHPSPAEIRAALEARLGEISRGGEALDAITLSGNGEPTLHPDFPAAVGEILGARDRRAKGVRVAALSNGSEAGRNEIREALLRLDVRMMKLDAGDPEVFRRLNRPVAPRDLDAYESHLRALAPIVVQSCFVAGACDNASEESLGSWVKRLSRIRPSEVHVYSLHRVPAERGLERVLPARLEAIAERVRREAGVPAKVF